MLTLKSVQAGYGRLPVLKGISVHVRPGEVVTLIGGNGAGKTTTLRTISGLLPPRKGAIEFAGQDLTRMPAERIVTLGLALVPEGRRVFRTLSVTANLELGAFFRKDQSRISTDMNHVFDLFPVLKERRRQMGGTLSGGEQQMLAIGRALMSRPKLLLLDEPSLGLAPIIVQRIFDIIRDINTNDNTTILLVEQNANIALQIAKRGYVLETGNIVMEDAAGKLLDNPDIRKAYLGEA